MERVNLRRRWLLIIVVSALAVLAAAAVYPHLDLYLLTRALPAPGVEEEEQVLEKKLRLAIPSDALPGEYQLRVGWEDSFGVGLLALGDEITVVVGDDGGDGEGDGDGGGGGGNGGGGGGGEEASAKPVRTYAFAPSRGHEIAGVYSGVEQDRGLMVVKLAHSGARLAKRVAVTKDDYWLYINARHDSPGPVDMAVYLNEKAWKVIRLDKGDNRYRTHQVGLLRGFSGGTVRFRFLNDVYDRSDPTNEAKDRNLYVASWGLTTDPNRLPLKNVASQAVGGGQLDGWKLLPRLNRVIREELGEKFVTFDAWKYYARRLTISPARRESIQSEAQLRKVMQYWKGVRPSRPWGD